MDPEARIVDLTPEPKARLTHEFEGVITAVEPHQVAISAPGYNPVLSHAAECARCGRQRSDPVHDVNALDEEADSSKVPSGR